MPQLFPNHNDENLLICVPGNGVTKPFSTIISKNIVDYEFSGKSQAFPLYWYEENTKKKKELSLFGEENSQDDFIRHDGISDWILTEVRRRYSGTKYITKEHIFYYVYGILHSPQYRERFEDDLKKSLPRIPIVEKVEDFIAISKIGRELAELHLNYETYQSPAGVDVIGDPYTFPDDFELDNIGEYSTETEKYYRIYDVERMSFAKIRNEEGKLVPDKSTIIYNHNIRITNIPLEAYEYVVNGKSAIEWLIERYAVTTDKASGIVNNPNDWAREHSSPKYILRLVLSIITLSLKTNELVANLPKLNI
jgi:predicted helicase